ncbi:hypothetical protein D3C83_257320 [compost metagenome]
MPRLPVPGEEPRFERRLRRVGDDARSIDDGIAATIGKCLRGEPSRRERQQQGDDKEEVSYR